MRATISANGRSSAIDTVDPIRVIAALAFVLGLIGLGGFLLRRYGANGALLGAQNGGRISVVESCYLDARRKLVLVRRDNVEHLLLLADRRETVVETIGAKDE